MVVPLPIVDSLQDYQRELARVEGIPVQEARRLADLLREEIRKCEQKPA